MARSASFLACLAALYAPRGVLGFGSHHQDDDPEDDATFAPTTADCPNVIVALLAAQCPATAPETYCDDILLAPGDYCLGTPRCFVPGTECTTPPIPRAPTTRRRLDDETIDIYQLAAPPTFEPTLVPTAQPTTMTVYPSGSVSPTSMEPTSMEPTVSPTTSTPTTSSTSTMSNPPSGQPTVSPSTSFDPTVAPTKGPCTIDQPGAAVADHYTCAWVAKRPENRCPLGVASTLCCATCGPCDEPCLTMEPTVSPTFEPSTSFEPTVEPTETPTISFAPSPQPSAKPTYRTPVTTSEKTACLGAKGEWTGLTENFCGTCCPDLQAVYKNSYEDNFESYFSNSGRNTWKPDVVDEVKRGGVCLDMEVDKYRQEESGRIFLTGQDDCARFVGDENDVRGRDGDDAIYMDGLRNRVRGNHQDDHLMLDGTEGYLFGGIGVDACTDISGDNEFYNEFDDQPDDGKNNCESCFGANGEELDCATGEPV